MGKAPTDLTGKKFGKWLVIKLDRLAPPHKYYWCRCDCGSEKSVQGNSLACGTSTSCGCDKGAKIAAAKTVHGKSRHPAYQSWSAMRRRCSDPNFAAYPWYGARGIRVCERWDEFDLFWADMGQTWAKGLSIDRINPDGDYCPENCRWSGAKVQAQNKRNNLLMDTPWGAMAQAEAARRAGISLGALRNRIKAGWPKPTWFDPPAKRRP